MFKRLVLFVAIVLIAGTSRAASDPFIGTWKLNPSKSKLTDEMRVEALAANKYAFDFGGGYGATIVADGTDQPTNFGTTMSVAFDGPSTWRFVGKKNGNITSSATWNLSQDGNTLRDTRTVRLPNGSPLTMTYVYERRAGASGFAGRWVSTSEKIGSAFAIEIRPYGDHGLSFVNPAEKSTQNMEFDGKDYPDEGPDVLPGSVSSGRRVSDQALAIADKIDGKVTYTRELELSSDHSTLTMTILPAGRTEPNVLVFERQ